MINPLATKIIQAEDSRRLQGTKALGIKVASVTVCLSLMGLHANPGGLISKGP